MRRYVFPVLMGIVGVAVLMSLGFWQLRRMEEKRIYLDEIAARISNAPIPLPDKPFDIMDFDKPPEARKIAGVGQTLLNMLTGAISGRAAATKPGPDGSAVRAYLHELDDRQHAQSLQAIRMRSAVEQLMAADPALRAYHPDEVLSAVNEISRTAPQLQGSSMQMAATMPRRPPMRCRRGRVASACPRYRR